MKKTLFIILGLDFSGAENVLLQYLNDNKEIDPYFAFIYKGNAIREFNDIFGCERIYDLNISYKKNELRFIPKISQYRVKKILRPIIEQIHPEIVYFNNTHEIILSGELIKELKIPCIGHIHDMQASIGTIIKRYEAKRAFDKLTQVLTVSEACKKSWKYSRMQVVYNGVSDDYFEKNEYCDRRTPPIIGYAGMISNRKGFDLLATMIDIMGDTINWKIAYNIIEKEYVEVLDYIMAKPNVQVFCRLSRNEMQAFYDSLDILLIPSRQDPLPTVAIEAMARKTLVLGANTGGIPELVGSEKYLFKANSFNAMKMLVLDYCSLEQEEFKKHVNEQYKRAFRIFRNGQKKQLINSIVLDCFLGQE